MSDLPETTRLQQVELQRNDLVKQVGLLKGELKSAKMDIGALESRRDELLAYLKRYESPEWREDFVGTRCPDCDAVLSRDLGHYNDCALKALIAKCGEVIDAPEEPQR